MKRAELMRVTEASLYAGIEQAMVGNRVVDVSRAVQTVVEENGLYVVREYTGHGVGRQMHEPPQVLNYVSGDADGEYVLEPGVVFAIEPMVQAGTARHADVERQVDSSERGRESGGAL